MNDQESFQSIPLLLIPNATRGSNYSRSDQPDILFRTTKVPVVDPVLFRRLLLLLFREQRLEEALEKVDGIVPEKEGGGRVREYFDLWWLSGLFQLSMDLWVIRESIKEQQ